MATSPCYPTRFGNTRGVKPKPAQPDKANHWASKTLIKPSKTGQQRHIRQMHRVIE
jgi:hypothetical protein